MKYDYYHMTLRTLHLKIRVPIAVQFSFTSYCLLVLNKVEGKILQISLAVQLTPTFSNPASYATDCSAHNSFHNFFIVYFRCFNFKLSNTIQFQISILIFQKSSTQVFNFTVLLEDIFDFICLRLLTALFTTNFKLKLILN